MLRARLIAQTLFVNAERFSKFAAGLTNQSDCSEKTARQADRGSSATRFTPSPTLRTYPNRSLRKIIRAALVLPRDSAPHSYRPRNWRPGHMATLKRPDGTQICYQVVGNRSGKLPLVLIHGWCSNHELWVHQVKYFGKKHPLLMLDRRGHGRSTTSGMGHDAMTHAADIAAVTSAAGLRSVVAIGHAGGGPGTLQFIRENPKLVKAGVLIDTFLGTLPKFGDPG